VIRALIVSPSLALGMTIKTERVCSPVPIELATVDAEDLKSRLRELGRFL